MKNWNGLFFYGHWQCTEYLPPTFALPLRFTHPGKFHSTCQMAQNVSRSRPTPSLFLSLLVFQLFTPPLVFLVGPLFVLCLFLSVHLSRHGILSHSVSLLHPIHLWSFISSSYIPLTNIMAKFSIFLCFLNSLNSLFTCASGLLSSCDLSACLPQCHAS